MSFFNSIAFLKQEIERVEKLGVTKLVLHPGSHVGLGIDTAIENIIKVLNNCITKETNVDICLETMAGKGSELGYCFEQIQYIKEHVQGSFVLENDFDTSGGDFAGYDWVINDKALFKALRSKKGVNIEDFPLFKEYCKDICVPDLLEIKNEKDIAALEDVSFGFHDSLIHEYEEKDGSIVIRFDTTWDCYITVTFDGVVEADFKEKVGEIYERISI